MSLPAAWRPQRWRVKGGGSERNVTAAAAASKGGVDRRPEPGDFCGPSVALRRASSLASPLAHPQRAPLRQSQVSAWAHACVGSSSSSSGSRRGVAGASVVARARVEATVAPLKSCLSSFRRHQQADLTAARASSNAAAAAGSATSLQASAPGSTTDVSIQFDNGADAEGTGATLLTVEAPGADDLLAEATGVLDALGLRVQSAAIHREGAQDTSGGSSPGGGARLAFRVTGEGGGQVPEPAWEGVRGALAALWGGVGGGALSTMPAIYGVAAEAEVKRLRPLSTGAKGDAAALELAAAEMAQAAAQLVAVEREVHAAADLVLAAEAGGAGAQRSSASFSMSNPVALKAALDAAESRRAEAAAQLERRMAAMEAVLASRRAAADASLVAVASREPSTALGDVLSILSGPMPSSQLLSQASPAAAAAEAALSPEASPSAAAFAGAAGSMLGAGISSGPAAGSGREIVLQGFNWESHRDKWYKKLESQVDEIAEAGFTAVWLPPPSDSVSAQGYLPRDLYKLDSAYGSEAELRSLVRALHGRGLKAIADIVINHRCAHTQDEQGRWNRFGGRLPWDESAICCNNQRFGGKGAHKTGDDYVAAPNIDHTQERVRNDLIGEKERERERERKREWGGEREKRKRRRSEKNKKLALKKKKKTSKTLSQDGSSSSAPRSASTAGGSTT